MYINEIYIYMKDRGRVVASDFFEIVCERSSSGTFTPDFREIENGLILK